MLMLYDMVFVLYMHHGTSLVPLNVCKTILSGGHMLAGT